MSEKSIYRKFEELVKKIISLSDYEVVRGRRQQDGYKFDIVIRKNKDEYAYIDVRLYRTKRLYPSQLKRALLVFNDEISKQESKHGLLVFSSLVDIEIKRNLEEEFGILVWDRNSLYSLTDKSPDLREQLLNILTTASLDSSEDSLEDITEIKTDLSQIWEFSIETKPALSNRGSELCKEVHAIPGGKKKKEDRKEGEKDYPKLFEEKCEEILKYVFDSDLKAWHHQARTDDELNQFDLICRISSTNDFWISLSRNFNSRYVLFEFKNYKKEIKQGQVYTTEKYLFNRALRSVGFIISRKGAGLNAITAMKGALREHGKLLISLELENICELLRRKDKGEDYNGYLSEIVDDFLIKLSR